MTLNLSNFHFATVKDKKLPHAKFKVSLEHM